MEKMINGRQFTWKFQFIGNLTNSFQDFIGTHIMTTQVSFLAISKHPFHWLNFQIHFITFLKLQIPSLMIGIRLLPTTGCLQPPYDIKIIQSVINQIRTEKHSLSHFKPSNRRPTSPTILGFIWIHGNG